MSEKTCLNCFAPLSGGPVCGQCGFNNAEYQSQPHHLPPGTVLRGRYIIGRAMGQGGFGITYVGFDLNLDFRVAIKEYFPEGTALRDVSRTAAVSCYPSQSTRDRYDVGLRKCVNEARALAKLGAVPSVVRVQDFFQENNTVYIVMEFVEGVTLNAWLRQLPQKPDFRKAVTLLAPVGAALEEIHASGFVHRDISPDNVMITKKGEPKLLDFGAVKAVATGGSVTENPVIKRGFSPMEMYTTDGKIGPWTDMYAYCATLCWMLLGRPPEEPMDRVEDDSLPDMLAKIISPAQAAALLKGLAFQPKQRYQSMAELLAALNACKDDAAPVRDPANTVPINSGTETPADPARTLKAVPQRDPALTQKAAPPLNPVQTSAALSQRVPAREQKTSPLPSRGRPAPAEKAPAQPPVAAKKKKKTPVLAAVIAAVAVLSIIIGVVVSRPSGKVSTTSSVNEPLASASVGDYVEFGSYEQDNDTSNGKENVEWLVLAKEDGKALLISRYGLDCQPYNTASTSVTWETCTLRTWLNGTFLNEAFSAEEQNKIPYSTVTADGNPDYDTDAGNDTTDKIFLLSITEAERYFSSDEARKCQPTAYAKAQGTYVFSDTGCCWWWLRSPGDGSSNAAYVSYFGGVHCVGHYFDDFDGAVRPALWINLNS